MRVPQFHRRRGCPTRAPPAASVPAERMITATAETVWSKWDALDARVGLGAVVRLTSLHRLLYCNELTSPGTGSNGSLVS